MVKGKLITCSECGHAIYDKDHMIEKGFAGSGVFMHLECADKLKAETLKAETLRELHDVFSTGHPDFLNITLEELGLYGDKNHDYARDGDPNGNFKRVAAIKALYPGFPDDKPIGVCITYMLKQLDAAMYMLSKGYEAKVESVDKRLGDISVYSKIGMCILQESEGE